MRIALFGGSGRIGSCILREAVNRGHAVTVITRHPDRVMAGTARVITGDATDPLSVTASVADHDAVISAVSGFGADDEPTLIVDAARALIQGLRDAGVDRLLVVGGAGSLLTPEGVRLIDRPEFPEAWKPGSRAQIQALTVYREEATQLQWTYLSPADIIEPGERTGTFTLGNDEAVFDADGQSRISTEDYAMALLDELEHPKHVGQRFTVGYA
ncbi:MAG TPA: NAD(P)-dependent oxidoreductase [Solirubrobacteraceae bacterium]|nr:NAD(P)-dependent oxidoreductase [Solirubrobacteraceae bacterium]